MRSSGRPLGPGAIGGVLAALLVLLATACGSEPTGPTFEVITEVEFAATLGIDLALMTETPSGVWIQDLAIGTGDTAVDGDTLFVTYTGWLRDGVEFDSGEWSYVFFDGRTAIGGWHWGMEGQQVGGLRKIIIPPEWGYGGAGNGPIYPGAVMVFDLLLDSIHATATP